MTERCGACKHAGVLKTDPPGTGRCGRDPYRAPELRLLVVLGMPHVGAVQPCPDYDPIDIHELSAEIRRKAEEIRRKADEPSSLDMYSAHLTMLNYAERVEQLELRLEEETERAGVLEWLDACKAEETSE